METNVATQPRAYNEDLATYLDKLLRQDYRQPPQAPSRPSWEHTRDVLRPSRPEIPPPPETTESQEIETPPADPPEAKPSVPIKEKAKKEKRPKRTLRLKRTTVRSKKRREKPKNSRQTAMLVLVPVLAVTLLVLVRKPGNSSPTPTASPSGINMTKPMIETTPEIIIDWEVPPLYKPTGRDPMASIALPIARQDASGAQAVASTKPVIKGILYSEDRPAVIIDTDLLHIGDEVSGAKITKINRDSVEFEADGQTWTQTVTPVDKTPGGQAK